MIVLSKDNFLKISRSFLSLFLFKVGKQAEKKSHELFQEKHKRNDNFRMETIFDPNYATLYNTFKNA